MDTYLNIWSFSEAAEVLGSDMTRQLMVSPYTNTMYVLYARRIFAFTVCVDTLSAIPVTEVELVFNPEFVVAYPKWFYLFIFLSSFLSTGVGMAYRHSNREHSKIKFCDSLT